MTMKNAKKSRGNIDSYCSKFLKLSFNHSNLNFKNYEEKKYKASMPDSTLATTRKITSFRVLRHSCNSSERLVHSLLHNTDRLQGPCLVQSLSL